MRPSTKKQDRDVAILELIARLTNDVKVARKHSLDHTVQLLQIAILELSTVAYSISDDELRAITAAMDDRQIFEAGPAMANAGEQPT
jgi:hypothetical protein